MANKVVNPTGMALNTAEDLPSDIGAWRPYFRNKDGRPVVCLKGPNGKPRVQSAPKAYATLREDEFELVDETLVEVAQEQLNAVQDLRDANLSFDAGDFGTVKSEYDEVADTRDADVSMVPNTQADNDAPTFTRRSVPVPIVHRQFHIDLRRLQASRRTGESIDTTTVDQSARKVLEGMEKLVINGTNGPTVDGTTVEGYTSSSNRVTGTLTAAWDSQTGTDIIGDVSNMIQDLVNNFRAGPACLYIPTNYVSVMGEDYKAESGMSVRQRILQFDQIRDVKQVDFLNNDEVLLVRMSRQVVDFAEIQDLTTVDWESGNGFMNFFQVLMAAAPRIKSDANGNSGVVHYTT